jgi:hypothetical protein
MRATVKKDTYQGDPAPFGLRLRRPLSTVPMDGTSSLDWPLGPPARLSGAMNKYQLTCNCEQETIWQS